MYLRIDIILPPPPIIITKITGYLTYKRVGNICSLTIRAGCLKHSPLNKGRCGMLWGESVLPPAGAKASGHWILLPSTRRMVEGYKYQSCLRVVNE